MKLFTNSNRTRLLNLGDDPNPGPARTFRAYTEPTQSPHNRLKGLTMPYLLTSLLILLLGFPNALPEASILNGLWVIYVIIAKRSEIKPKTKNQRQYQSTFVH